MEVINLAGYTLDEKLQIAKRYLVPAPDRSRTGCIAKPDRVHRRGASGDRRRVHARGRGAKPGARDRHRVPQGRPRGRRGQGRQAKGHDLGEAGARAARPAPLLRRAAAPHQGPRRRHRAGLDAGRRRGPVRRGDRDARRRQADDHRPARRRDAGVGAGGALLGARPSASSWRRTSRDDWFAEPRHPRPRPGRGGAQGRPLGRRGDGDRAGVARHRASPSRRTSR